MLRPFQNISIQQVAPFTYKDGEGVVHTVERNELIELDFAITYEINSGWESHTDNANIVLPKNVLLKIGDFLFKRSGSYNVILGGADSSNFNEDGSFNTISPLAMRGDIVYISDGYRFKNIQNQECVEARDQFFGYISKVHSDIPIEIDLEDNFYLLKRVPVGQNHFSGNLIELCRLMVARTNALFHEKNSQYPELSVTSLTDSLTANFSLGFLDIGNITCAELLSRLKTQYKLESFFVDNELHFGFPIYDESRAPKQMYFFEFQNNILDNHTLEYKNKQDIILSTVVHSQTIKDTGTKTRSGLEKTKKERQTVLVYWDIVTETFKYIVKKKGEPIPVNDGGERHECIYPISPTEPEPSVDTLYKFGVEQLKKYFYTGFRGSFTSFGFPFVQWNDNIVIVDKVLSDRNGVYKVKRVRRTGGIGGARQEIYLDYKLNTPIPESTEEIFMI